jgi:hypothetical protein
MAQRTLSRAVVERRAPGEVEGDDALAAKWRAADWFATPPWGARAGAEIIKRLDPAAASIWDCACGDGIMAEAFRDTFSEVYASDINDYGYTESMRIDFLMPHAPQKAAWIATNPPFKAAADFVRQGLREATRGVAVLCRSVFLESNDRYSLLFEGDNPLAWVAPFSERLPMSLGPWDPEVSSATAYSWFGFMKSEARQDAGIGERPVIIPIPPGTRDRLWFPDDVRRFVKAKDGSLL